MSNNPVIFEEYSKVIELLIFVAGGFGLLRNIADMERYYQLRVVVLTTLYSLVIILFFIVFFVTNIFGQSLIEFDDHPKDTFTLL